MLFKKTQLLVFLFTIIFSSFTFSQTTCNDTSWDKGVDFNEIDVGMGGKTRQEMLDRAEGRYTVPQIFIDNGLEYLLFAHGNDYEKDPIHLNDIQPINVDGEFWSKGDVFLSIRNQSMVLLYRPSTNKIIWKGIP